jgi:hypothetical protein
MGQQNNHRAGRIGRGRQELDQGPQMRNALWLMDCIERKTSRTGGAHTPHEQKTQGGGKIEGRVSLLVSGRGEDERAQAARTGLKKMKRVQKTKSR